MAGNSLLFSLLHFLTNPTVQLENPSVQSQRGHGECFSRGNALGFVCFMNSSSGSMVGPLAVGGRSMKNNELLHLTNLLGAIFGLNIPLRECSKCICFVDTV